MRTAASRQVSRVSANDDLSTDTAPAAVADEMTSHELDTDADAAAKRGAEPTFRLGRRRGSAGVRATAGSAGYAVPADRRSPSWSPTFRLGRRAADRRATTFRLGRRSPFNSLTNDDRDDVIPAY